MAKPNYQFEKRQRDLAKKAKQEEKRLAKLAGKASTDDATPEADDGVAVASAAVETAPAA
ncbi:hypothetical protein AT959_09595 [Dechloromonas denitrificans]|uniref:Uncharacterized protein n=1 Tax=Dechloromonas denitrificans TaxID=281362 RepID=A0A133XJ25_9RHOO|nr:hypothetical protein [Dechloromonas denitrificans]KXB30953.1 hypothetical protein AT959_09595 [Dechloromonas denitrificans]